MIVLIDNGHGINTPGKRSPDKKLFEYKYTREIATLIETELKKANVTVIRVVTENEDIRLSERVARINKACKRFGSRNCCAISLHIDACASDGNWHSASGFSVRVSKNASDKSKKLAKCIYEQAERASLKGNRSVPPEKYWVQDLAICRETNCAAVLTESLFQDNKHDVEFLLSENGKNTIVQLHVKGILDYIKSQQN